MHFVPVYFLLVRITVQLHLDFLSVSVFAWNDGSNEFHIQNFIDKPLVEKMVFKRSSKLFDLFSVKKHNFKLWVLTEEAQNGLLSCHKSQYKANVDGSEFFSESFFLLCFVLYSFLSSFYSIQTNWTLLKYLRSNCVKHLNFLCFTSWRWSGRILVAIVSKV